jgi:hypothetical protein
MLRPIEVELKHHSVCFIHHWTAILENRAKRPVIRAVAHQHGMASRFQESSIKPPITWRHIEDHTSFFRHDRLLGLYRYCTTGVTSRLGGVQNLHHVRSMPSL